jgi:hypothetical protein
MPANSCAKRRFIPSSPHEIRGRRGLSAAGFGGAAECREVFSVAEECPGISDEEAGALCSERRILLTLDEDFG